MNIYLVVFVFGGVFSFWMGGSWGIRSILWLFFSVPYTYTLFLPPPGQLSTCFAFSAVINKLQSVRFSVNFPVHCALSVGRSSFRNPWGTSAAALLLTLDDSAISFTFPSSPCSVHPSPMFLPLLS